MKHLTKVTFLIAMLVLVVGAVSAQDVATELATQVGDVIQWQGQVVDTDGNPITNATIELWQADSNGNYNHPDSAAMDTLLDDFQYFGTTNTDENGYFAFLTVKPSPDEDRPTHLNFKVKIDGETALTSQFYFEEDRTAVEADDVFNNAGDSLFLQASDVTDADNIIVRVETGNIIIDLNGDGADKLTATAEQVEGAYYPDVDLSSFDNNLLSVAKNDAPIQPLMNEMATFSLLDLNTATADEFLTIPSMSNRMTREFDEYRPYASIQQFRREIGKYVDEAQVTEYEQYVYVPVNVDSADAETLKQIPGLTDEIATALIAARPFGSNDAFLTALGDYLTTAQVSYAQNYLVSQ